MTSESHDEARSQVTSSERTGRVGDDITAVIVAFGSSEDLHRCLRTLVDEGVREIIVVDNADPFQRRYDEEIDGVRIQYYCPGRNLGYGRAVNLGVSLSTKPYLVIANPDVEFSHGSVDVLLSTVQDGLVALAAPKVLNEDGTRYPSFREFPSLGAAAIHGIVGLFSQQTSATRQYRGDLLDPVVTTKVPWVSGAAFLVSRRAFEAIGGFDSQYFLYLEDVDLCRRLRVRDLGVYYVPDAVVVHRQGSSSRLRPLRSRFQHHRSLWIYARSTIVRMPLLLVSGVGTWVRFLLQSVVGHEKKS